MCHDLRVIVTISSPVYSCRVFVRVVPIDTTNEWKNACALSSPGSGVGGGGGGVQTCAAPPNFRPLSWPNIRALSARKPFAVYASISITSQSRDCSPLAIPQPAVYVFLSSELLHSVSPVSRAKIVNFTEL